MAISKVFTSTRDGYRMIAPTPTIQHAAVLRSREYHEKFFNPAPLKYGYGEDYKQGEARKGAKVVRV